MINVGDIVSASKYGEAWCNVVVIEVLEDSVMAANRHNQEGLLFFSELDFDDESEMEFDV